jgi:regulator of sigma D
MENSIQKYLDKSLEVLKEFNLLPAKKEETGLASLLEEIVAVDEPKVLAIAQTVQYMGDFNELVRSQVESVNVSDRYNDMTERFDSIREDSKAMVDQLADGKIDFKEKIYNWQMKIIRGTPHKRFDKIKDIYVDVTNDTKDALGHEEKIMNAYMDFRSAVKQSEAIAYEVKKTQATNLENAKVKYDNAANIITTYKGTDESERSRLELARDEAQRGYAKEDARMQLITDVADNLKIGYNVGETLVAKLQQTHGLKEQVYKKAVTFFQTNEHVFTIMDALYTSQRGLHEATQTINSMAQGANKGLEQAAELGGQLEKEAIKAGYGKQLDATSVQKLVDAIISFQTESVQMINQYRQESAENAKEIERIVEEGKEKSRQAVLNYRAKFTE